MSSHGLQRAWRPPERRPYSTISEVFLAPYKSQPRDLYPFEEITAFHQKSPLVSGRLPFNTNSSNDAFVDGRLDDRAVFVDPHGQTVLAGHDVSVEAVLGDQQRRVGWASGWVHVRDDE